MTGEGNIITIGVGAALRCGEIRIPCLRAGISACQEKGQSFWGEAYELASIPPPTLRPPPA